PPPPLTAPRAPPPPASPTPPLPPAPRGARDRVFDALLAHPLVGQIELADQLTDRLLAHNREHLPWARG
ncbi:6-phospho-beta-glucosidase, partial [Kitasatospora sp. NPDC059462]